MDRRGRLIASIVFLLIIGKLEQVNCYKWVSLKSGDNLPQNAILITKAQGYVYVGRARNFDEILPAEISLNGSAVISSCQNEIPKEKFEVLTAEASEKCEWKHFSYFANIDETIVRGGTAWNGEPIYIGAATSDETYPPLTFHIASIYLEDNYLYDWVRGKIYGNNGGNWQYLSCNTKLSWVDSSATILPKNTVSGGKSGDYDYEMHVARLKRYCDVVVGQVIPEMSTAMAILNDGTAIEATYCQVLISEPNEYTWISASDGEIPDFAVACGKSGSRVTYVARINKTITHLTHGEALRDHLDYDILVKN